jgi:hypothetical protein
MSSHPAFAIVSASLSFWQVMPTEPSESWRCAISTQRWVLT